MLNWWGIGSAYKDSPAIGWVLLTFLIFVALLYRFVRAPMAVFFQERSDHIRTAIEEARIAKEDAARKLKQYETRLAELDQEIAHMKADFQKQGEMERLRLQAEAQKVAELIRAESLAALKAEVLRTIAKLKREVAEKVIGSTLGQIRLDATHEQRLVTNFVRESRAELKR